jgi:hypothetical protein
MPRLFDPLVYLRAEFRATPAIGPDGITLRFDGPVLAHQRRKAQTVALAYDRLLRLQLEHDGASVQKLMAWGKIRIQGGRYVAG